MQKIKISERTPLFAFLLGIAITIAVGLYSQQALEERDNSRLTKLADDVNNRVNSLVHLITYGLAGTKGLFAASKSVEYAEFKSFVDAKALSYEFPGVWGFGFAQYVKRADLRNFERKVRADDRPMFKVKTSGQMTDHIITRFLEPEQDNQAAIGFDIGSDPYRREAAETAMLTGEPTLTRNLSLLQDKNNETGFLYLRPVYRKGAPVNTREERRAAIFGWVFAPFTLERVLKPVVERYDERVSLTVYEGTELVKRALLYSNATETSPASMKRVQKLEVGQRVWTVVIKPRPGFFTQDISRYFPTSIFAIGILLSVIVSRALWYYLEAKNRALTSRLEEGERYVQGIVDSANFSIIVTEPDGIIRVFNRMASEWLGYEPEELIGKETPALIHDAKEVAARAEEISSKLNRQIVPGFEVFIAEAQEHIDDNREWTYIRKDGSRFPVMLSVTAMRNESGDIMAYMGIADDITERKLAEQERQESEERFRSSFNYASHGIALVGLNGRWLRVNHALCEMLGYSEENLLRRTFQEITHPEDLQTDLEHVKRVLSGEIESYDMEKRYFHASGGIVWVMLSVSLVRDSLSQPLYFVSQVQDITEQKRAMQQLQERTSELMVAKEAALEAVRAKSQFLANMSHEIRTPLTSIIGYSESLMEDDLSKDEAALALETITRNGNHLLGVISDILDISKIEAEKLEIEMVPVDLAELISDVANLMQHKAQEKGLSLGFEYLFPIPRRVLTDPTRLKQILINLVGNAVKFTSVGGVKIHVKFLRADERLEFAVIDTGPGLTEWQRSKLFQAFSQADASTTRTFGGTGLGLMISSQLAQRLGGEVTLESESGKGSVFTVSISTGPVEASSLVASIEPSEREVEIEDPKGVPQLVGKVLVAEDGEDNQNLISFLLGKTGVKFKVVENGALAAEQMAKEHFDLVLMDIQMPVMDGYSATALIRSRGFAVPIVALTANAMKSDIDKALSVGFTDFLGKPFTRSDLFATLSLFLGKDKDNAGGLDLEDSDADRETSHGEGNSPSERSLAIIREDPEILPLLISVIQHLPDRYKNIVRAIEAGDWKQASMLAHSMRGATAQLGLETVAKIAGVIERAADKKLSKDVAAGMLRLEKRIDEAQALVDVFKAEVL